ncbi:MAG TPA: ester cyclase [Myxococcota bacterium]|nr:ester cyclase [Myxococcota bacterium]
MAVSTITQDAFFGVPPHDVFEIFVDAGTHSAMSGGERAEIDARVGGEARVFEDAVSATFLEIAPGRRIVQTWRDRDWPDGHQAQLELQFLPLNDGRGTHVHLTLSGVPADKARQTANGWRDYYWVPIAEFLRDAKVRPVRRFFLEFKKRANLDAVDETWAEDSMLHLGGTALGRGTQPQKSVGRQIFEAFSDLRIEVEDQIVEGDRVVERHRAVAIHAGEFMGISATGREVSWTGNHIYRIADGRIAEAWSEVSLYELIAQLTEER